MLGAGRIWAVAAILGGSWGEMGMDGCSGKSCPSDSEMYSPARAQQWDGDCVLGWGEKEAPAGL